MTGCRVVNDSSNFVIRFKLQMFVSLFFIIMKTCPCNIQIFFSGVKNEKSTRKKVDIFLIFAQNIDCGYTLEPPR